MLLIRHMNCVAATLAAEPDSFEPLFAEPSDGDETHVIVDDWCFGYMTGVWLDEDAWALTEPTVHGLLAPIELNGTEEGWKALETMARADAARRHHRGPCAERHRKWGAMNRVPVAAGGCANSAACNDGPPKRPDSALTPSRTGAVPFQG